MNTKRLRTIIPLAVIAVVASGLMLSLLPQRHTAATARTKLQAQSVWTTLEFVLNGIIFVVLGMQLPRLLEPAAEGSLGDPATLLGVVVVLTLVLEGVRFAWLLAMDVRAAIASGKGARSCFAPAALRGTLAMAFAGAKGGITLSLMLMLTAAAGLSASGQATLVSIASGMIVLTLVLADFAVPALTPSKRSAKRTRDRVDAEIDLTLGVIASIEADAHLTGAVKGAAVDAVDEPATVIVMHRYAEMLEDPDLILLPGTKNTMHDLAWMRQSGVEASVLKAHASGCPVFGICGGYQMLGEYLEDPHGVEEGGSMRGMGLLPMRTVFTEEKTRTRVDGTFSNVHGILQALSGVAFSGYEIHMGQSIGKEGTDTLTEIHDTNRQQGEPAVCERKSEGAMGENVYGTYVHGIFDSMDVVNAVVRALAERKGIDPEGLAQIDYAAYKEQQYDKMAAILRQYLDMEAIYRIVEAGV